MNTRVRNFYPGPGALPLPVLLRIQDELLDYSGLGMSIMETSHRSQAAVELIADTVGRIKRLLGLGDNHDVVLLQGGASLQFAMVPMNLSLAGGKVDYIDSGYWTARAIAEARRLSRDVAVIASSGPDHHRLPDSLSVRPDTNYLHICTNNTVEGTQWGHIPQADVPIVLDMSSDILSRRMNLESIACLYAHAQKTLGPAGVTVAAIRRDMLDRIPNDIPEILDFRTHIKHASNFNTPPIFAIYVVRCVLDWLENDIGGLDAMEALNQRKADLLYKVLDESDFYRCPVEVNSRSVMNVVFNLPNPELEARFIAAATARGLVGLAGHRSVGGCRASLYNPVPMEAVEELAEFMRNFVRQPG